MPLECAVVGRFSRRTGYWPVDAILKQAGSLFYDEVLKAAGRGTRMRRYDYSPIDIQAKPKDGHKMLI